MTLLRWAPFRRSRGSPGERVVSLTGEICVVGLGYIGLPTASVLATHGYRVVGVDTDEAVLRSLETGKSHIAEPGLQTLVEAAVTSGNLQLSGRPRPAAAFIIAVPTPIRADRRADLSYIARAGRSIAPHLRPGNLVVLESTCPPGTTRGFLLPILEESGLRCGHDLYVAHCPERVLPGRILKEIVENNRIIGGVDPESAEKAKEIYESFVRGQIHLTDATTAELVKIVENTFRDINIAFANELTGICDRAGVDVWKVIRLANQHPRVSILQPGPGVGGHCLPVDPWFLIEKFPEETRLIRAGREVNDWQPHRVFEMIRELTRGVADPKVTILGITYKANVGDIRKSPALQVVQLLEADGYAVSLHDPHVAQSRLKLSPLEDALSASDCIVVLADHAEFGKLDPERVGRLVRSRVLIDTRKALDVEWWTRAGFATKVLGSPLRDGARQNSGGRREPDSRGL